MDYNASLMVSRLPSRLSRIEPIVVGFAGHIGAGKTSAAQYLRSKYGFQYTRYSKVLQDWLSPDGPERDRLQKLGWDIMAGGLQTQLNSRLIAGLDRSRSAAIDGLRHPIDFDGLTSSFGESFHMVFIEVRQECRFERLRSRYSTYAAFQAADMQPVETQIDRLKPLASITISNNESLANFNQRLDTWIARCGLEDQK